MKPRIPNDGQVIEEIEIRWLRMKELEQLGDAAKNPVEAIALYSEALHKALHSNCGLIVKALNEDADFDNHRRISKKIEQLSAK